MKVLLIGVGMQGKATLHDLVRSDMVTQILAADQDYDGLATHVSSWGYGDKVRTGPIDAGDPEAVDGMMAAFQPDIVIDLAPVPYHPIIAHTAVQHRAHYLNASYASPEMAGLAKKAADQNLVVLLEFGMDPGMDLVMLGEAVRGFDRVHGIISYGAGFPEEAAANNPIKYKITWTFDGVLRAYRRAARVIRDGQMFEISDRDMFRPEHMHVREIPSLGLLEAAPNGDALKYAELLGIPRGQLRDLGRYILRWPGHCAFWQTIVDLGLLDSEPVIVDGAPVNRRRYLAAALEPLLQYAADERDIAIVRIEVTGAKNGQQRRAVYQVIDKRDLETGFTAMQRTVGFTISIGALMIAAGQIDKRGLLSPLTDVPYGPYAAALKARGIGVTSETIALESTV
jgi:saccharopine dehydrogenase-like NADP-dependent oxidoreductase